MKRARRSRLDLDVDLDFPTIEFDPASLPNMQYRDVSIVPQPPNHYVPYIPPANYYSGGAACNTQAHFHGYGQVGHHYGIPDTMHSFTPCHHQFPEHFHVPSIDIGANHFHDNGDVGGGFDFGGF